MNSETQLLVKMHYTSALCSVLLQHVETLHAFSTIHWLKTKATEITDLILEYGKAKAISWIRVADRCAQHMEKLNTEQWSNNPVNLNSKQEEILYNLSVLTHLLEDVKNTKIAATYDLEAMLIAAYTLEDILGLPNKKLNREDEIREAAALFLDQLYKKMGEI